MSGSNKLVKERNITIGEREPYGQEITGEMVRIMTRNSLMEIYSKQLNIISKDVGEARFYITTDTGEVEDIQYSNVVVRNVGSTVAKSRQTLTSTGATEYNFEFRNGAGSNDPTTIKFDPDALPVGIGTTVGLDVDGKFIKTTSAMKYKNVLSEKLIPYDLFADIFMSQWYYLNDSNKNTQVGPVAEHIEEITGVYANSFVIYTKSGEIEGIYNNNIIYMQLDYLNIQNKLLVNENISLSDKVTLLEETNLAQSERLTLLEARVTALEP